MEDCVSLSCRWGFLYVGTISTWGGVILCCGGSPVHYGMLTSFLHSLDCWVPPAPNSRETKKCLWLPNIVSRGTKFSSVKNHCYWIKGLLKWILSLYTQLLILTGIKLTHFSIWCFLFFWVLSDAGAKHLVGGQKEVEERSRVAEMI